MKPCLNNGWLSLGLSVCFDFISFQFGRFGTCVPGQSVYADGALALLFCAPAVRPLHPPVADDYTLTDDSFLDTMSQGITDALWGTNHGTMRF